MISRVTGPREQYRLLLVDLVMVGLLFVNLGLIVFDWLYTYDVISQWLSSWAPEFNRWYGGVVHPNFLLIDLAFVGIFILDFLVSWILALFAGLYHRWFFYPFVHWYDLLGCVPIAGFRFLRLLRVVTILYRLHRAGVINLRDSVLGRTAGKYYDVLVEEVSDRVVIKMISDTQEEVRNGGPLMDKILTDVIHPRKRELVEWISHRVQTATANNYAEYRQELEGYIRTRVTEALENNREFARLNAVPVVGSVVKARVERGVADVVTEAMHGFARDLASERNERFVNEFVDLVFDALLAREEENELNRMVVETIDRALEMIKRQVAVQQWKLRDLATDEADYARRLRESLEDER